MRAAASFRDAVHTDSRHKKEAALALHEDGLSALKIADQMGVDIKKIKKWLGVN